MRKSRLGMCFGIVFVAVVSLSLGGFAHQAGAAPWRHGVIKAKADAGFVFMPQRGGFTKKHGLEVEYLEFKNEPIMVRALFAGELDTFEGSPASTIAAASHGGKIRIIGCQWPGLLHALFVRKDMKNLQDIKGKTIGISTPGSLPDVLARAVLEKAGISADSVKFVKAGGSADRIRALIAGVIDMAPSSSEFAPLLEKQGLRIIAHAQDVAPNYPRWCVMGVGENLKKKADQTDAFLAAMMEGYAYSLKHRDEVIALSMKMSKLKPGNPRPAYIFDEVIKYHAVNPTMEVPMVKIAWLHDTMVKLKKIKKPFDYSTVVDESYRKRAMKLANF